MMPGRGLRPVHSGAAPAGEDELCVVTVLCAGLCMPEHTDDVDALVAQAEELLTIASAACASYGGRVERLPGGDLLALFGVDHIHEDDAERAIRASLTIQEAAHEQALAVQIGINTGIAYCTRTSPGAETEALLMGPVVALATRLRTYAGSGETLVGASTYNPTRGVFAFTDLELALPGSSRLVHAYQVQRLRSAITKERGIEGLAAGLIGREQEMNQLESAMARVLEGEGQLILVSGAAGVGKSRLVAELKERWTTAISKRHLPDGLSDSSAADALPANRWLEGRCQELATTTGFWPFVEMLRQSLNNADDGDKMTPGDQLVITLHRLAARGDLTERQVDAIGPVLSHLLSLRVANGWSDHERQIDPKRGRRQTFDGVQLFLTALARQSALALVFEDLHWGDGLSLALISELITALASTPLLLVCIYRPEQAQAGEPLLALAQHQCPDRCTALTLQELSAAESSRLLASLLPVEQLPEALRARILAKAQGNPFFLEEIVRAQIDTGVLFQQENIWRTHGEHTTLNPPDTVQSVVLSRVDRLPPELRRLLQIASVLGHFCQRRLLAALAPPDLDLERALVTLSSLALIHREPRGPGEVYSFRHVLVQEAIYQSLPSKRRGALHQQVAEALETLHSGNLAPHIEQIAYHYDRSDAAHKAIEYLVRAGEKAQQTYFNDEAINCFQRALARLDALSSSLNQGIEERPSDSASNAWAEADRWRLSALRGLGIVYWSISDLVEAEYYLHRAITHALKMGAPSVTWAPLYGWLCRLLRWQSRLDDLILVGQEGLARLGDETTSLNAAIIYSNLIEAYYLKDDRTHYHAAQQRIAQLLPKLPYNNDLFTAYGYMVLMQRDNNEGEQALKWVHAAQVKVEDSHDPLLAAWVHMWQVARYHESIGDMRTAIAQSEMGLERTRKIGDTKTLAWGLNHQAERYLAVGDLAQAQTVDEESLVLHRQLGLEGEIMEGTHILAQIRFCQGAVDEALRLAETALALEERTGFRYAAGLHRTLLGWLHLAQGQRVEAQTFFRSVLQTQPTDAQRVVEIYRSLAGLEAACADMTEFRALCQQAQLQRPALADLGLRQWWLMPATLDSDLQGDMVEAIPTDIKQGRWDSVDPFGDCAYTLTDDLTIHAANGRTLWGINLGAPRLVRPVAGDFAMQVTCSAALPDRPAIGGILLWRDNANYLRLTWGELGADQVAFAGALDNRNLVIGRGALSHAGRVVLRLERRGDAVRALCSADGREWYGVGETLLSADGPTLLGLHAIGQIDRILRPGAYPEGTAIRFAV